MPPANSATIWAPLGATLYVVVFFDGIIPVIDTTVVVDTSVIQGYHIYAVPDVVSAIAIHFKSHLVTTTLKAA